MLVLKGKLAVTRQPAPGNSSTYLFEWESDSNGDVLANLDPIEGVPWRLVTRPLDGPSDNYAVSLLDCASGADLLLGKGASRDTSNSETAYIYDGTNTSIRNEISGMCRFSISGAGATKTGIVWLTLLPVTPGMTL